jgi:tetratricopeptide (TPR) repeat protein
VSRAATDGGLRYIRWKATRIFLIGTTIACLLILAVFLVLAGLAIAEGNGERCVRGCIGAIVTATAVWAFGRAARFAGHRTTDMLIARCADTIDLDACDAAGHLQRGFAHARRREYTRAIAYYDAAIQLDPVYQPNAYVGRVNAYTALGQLDRMIAEYTEVIEQDPTNALAWCARATAYNALGQWHLAIADATEAIRLAPALYLGYDARGYGYWQRGNFNWLIKLIGIAWMLGKLAFLDRDHFSWRTPTGTRADHVQAIADFTEALRLNPGAWDCYAGRARAYRALGEHAKAAADETALHGAPAR